MSNRPKKQLCLSFDKPVCKYGSSCYQRNPDHKLKYSHPPSQQPNTELPDNDENDSTIPKPKKVKLSLSNTKSPAVVNVPKECESNMSPQSNPVNKSPKSPTVVNVPKEWKSKMSPQSNPVNKRPKSPAVVNVPKECESKMSPQSNPVNKRPKSPTNVKENVKDKFLVEMPPDFYELWDYCKTVNKTQPGNCFCELNVHLVGPYDVLAKKIENNDISVDSENILCHWRYFYDPPEFQTVIKKDGNEGYHIGYFRDDPSEMPFALASNKASVGPILNIVGDNIFAAVILELEIEMKKCSDTKTKQKFQKILSDLQGIVKRKNYDLGLKTEKIKARSRKVVAKTFNKFGIVVPVDGRGVGYRSLCDSDAKFKALLARICDTENEAERLQARVPLDHMITNVQLSNDECDFGMCLELGIDLFCFGDEYFHGDINLFLPLAYQLLNRPVFARIAKAHLLNRRKGDKLSIKDA